MSWTCSRCATKHQTDAEIPACHKQERSTTLLAVGALALLFVVALVVKILWAEAVYSDWTCAFAECRKIK